MKKMMLNVLGALSMGVLSSCMVDVADDMDVYPPDAYIATATPVYFEGRAAYWYGDRWYYRDGGHWRNYHSEPAYLHSYRARAVPVRGVVARPAMGRAYYGRAHGGGYRRR